MTRDRLTALIPAHNDDYTLWFCLRSIAPFFDEVFVLDDCSDDLTPDVVLDVARAHPHVRLLRHEGDQLGWIGARNRLLAATDAELLFWLDADDVLAEYNAGILRELADGSRPLVRLQLCEMWGDFDHSTQRLRHYDRCHLFVNRRLLRNGCWGGGSAAKLREIGGMTPARSEGPLLFHAKGVKPDRRLVERQFARKWMRRGTPGRLQDFAGLAEMPPEERHRRAMRMILHSRQDKLRRTWGSAQFGLHSPKGDGGPVAPQRPRVILDASRRFEILYGPDGQPVDRLDHGWASQLRRGPGA